MRAPFIAFLGPPSSGKSSLIGRLLIKTGIFSDYAVKDAIEDAKALSRPNDVYRLLVDLDLQERLRGHTLQLKLLSGISLPSGGKVKIIDTPGKIGLWRKIMIGAIISDALVIVHRQKCKRQEIEPYLKLANLLNRRVILVSIGEEKEKSHFEVDKKLLIGTCTVSNLSGRGIEQFISLIEKVKPRKLPITQHFRMPIIGRTEEGIIAIGVILEGSISLGEEVLISPPMKVGIVSSIEVEGKPVRLVTAGNDVGVALLKVGRQYVKEGYILSDIIKPPPRATKIKMKINYITDPEFKEKAFFMLNVHATEVACKIIDRGKEEVVLKLEKPIPVEIHEEHEDLGALVLRDSNSIVAYGTCIEILREKAHS